MYIINFCKNDQTNNYISCIAVFKKTNQEQNILEVKTKTNSFENNVLFHQIISSNFAKVTYDDNERKCFLEYNNTLSKINNQITKSVIKSVIKFDDSSASAYSNFKDDLNTMINTKIETLYYPNGNIFYVGDVTLIDNKMVPHGRGTFYYDNKNLKPKYCGEVENSKYDGAGIFYSYNEKISIVANNISNGIPTQKGKLYIDFNNLNYMFDINFLNVFSIIDLKYFSSKQDFVQCDSFVYNIAKIFWTFENNIDDVIFQEMSNDEKLYDIWNKINKLSTKIDNLDKNLKLYDMNNTIFFTILSLIFAAFSMPLVLSIK